MRLKSSESRNEFCGSSLQKIAKKAIFCAAGIARETLNKSPQLMHSLADQDIG
jgi:hypothetical protein